MPQRRTMPRSTTDNRLTPPPATSPHAADATVTISIRYCGVAGTSYRCPLGPCNRTSDCLQSLKRHIIGYHGRVTADISVKATCTACGREFTGVTALRLASSHFLGCRGTNEAPIDVRSFVCPLCPARSYSVRSARCHYHIAHEAAPVRADSAFHPPGGLHVPADGGAAEARAMSIIVPYSGSSTKYFCPVVGCRKADFGYVQMRSLVKHLQSGHDASPIITTFRCSSCPVLCSRCCRLHP